MVPEVFPIEFSLIKKAERSVQHMRKVSVPESPEQITVRHEKENAELERRLKEREKPRHRAYFAVLMFTLLVVYCIDEITTNVSGVIQSPALFDLFQITSRDVHDPMYAKGIDILALVGTLGSVITLAAPFYKSLADRFGRRPFLILNTGFFAVSLLVIAFAPNITVFALGYAFSLLFTPNDVQVMYILETAPKKHRAKIATIMKAVAILSLSLMGLLRTAFYNPDDMGWWRLVVGVPTVIAVAATLLALFLVKETPVFTNQRIEYLRLSDEERRKKAEKEKEKESAEQGGVINSIRFIKSHKQTRAIVIVALLFSISSVYTMYYESIMAGGLSTEAVSLAVTVYPLAYAPITLLSGFVADRFGRKVSSVGLGVTTVVMLALFILSIKLGWGAVLTGLFYGASLGGLWSAYDTIFFTITAESVPTRIRSSVMGTMNLLLIIGTVLGMGIVVLAQNFVDLGWICFAVCVPFMAISMVLLITRIHETKDVDMDRVTGTEWD